MAWSWMNIEPGAAPQCSSTPARKSSGNVANHAVYSSTGTRAGFAASCSSVSQSWS